MSLVDIVNDYNSIPKDTHPELEIKNTYKRVTETDFISIWERLKKSHTFALTNMVDIIVNEGENFSKRKTIDLSTKKEEIIQKTRIRNISYGGNRISLSSEKPSTFPQNKISLARFKSRQSAVIGNWRLDLTIISETSDLSSLPFKKTKFIEYSSVWDTMKKTNTVLIIKYEIEFEFIGKTITEKDISDANITFIELIEPGSQGKLEVQAVVNEIIAKLDKFGLRPGMNIKDIGNQPITLIKSKYYQTVFPNINKYYVCDKTDGERCLAIISDGEIKAATTENVFKFKDVKSESKTLIVDGEIYKDVIYIFDILYDGSALYGEDFKSRYEKLKNAFKKIKSKHLIVKDMVEIKSLDAIKTVFNDDKIYPTDGLMFTPIDGKYFDMLVYKWKPIEKLSIDFFISGPHTPSEQEKQYLEYIGAKDNVYYLCCGINSSQFDKFKMTFPPNYKDLMKPINIDGAISNGYFPILFSTTDNPYSYLCALKDNNLGGKIGEFSAVIKDDIITFKLDRLRPDKEILMKELKAFGNNYKTADTIWQSYRTPLTLEDLCTKPEIYFSQKKPEMYKVQVLFNSFVKEILINNFKKANFIVDLASGQGQDLNRIKAAEVKQVLFVDIDKAAISELNERKYSDSNFRDKKTNILRKEKVIKAEEGMKIYTMVYDLSNSYEGFLEKLKRMGIEKNSFNGVMINFAIHYLLKDRKGLMNFVSLVNSIIKKGGRVAITCFNGKMIFDKLKDIEYGKSYDLYEGEVLKYSIKKLYKGDKFEGFGQTIGVKLPFSGQNYYDEPLVDVDLLVSEFKKSGFEDEIFCQFGKFESDFAKSFPRLYPILTKDDKTYINLYSAITLWKKVD